MTGFFCMGLCLLLVPCYAAIWAGGTFTNPSFPVLNSVGVFVNESWHPLSSGFSPTTSSSLNGFVLVDDDRYLFAVGVFGFAGQAVSNGIAVWDQFEARWSGFLGAFSNGHGLPGNPVCVEYEPVQRRVVVGGCFLSIGGVSYNNVVALDPVSKAYSILGAGGENGFNGCVFDLLVANVQFAQDSPTLLAAGAFTRAGAASVSKVAMYSLGQWVNLGQGLDAGENAIVYSLAFDATRQRLYVGGAFTGGAVGLAGNGVAVWDGSVWAALPSAITGVVNALVVASGVLYVGGVFSLGTQPANVAVCALSTNSSCSALGGGIISPPHATVNAMVYENGKMYIGGSFQQAGNVTDVFNVVGWDGSEWFPLGTGLADAYGTDAVVKAIAVGLYISPVAPSPSLPPPLQEQYWWLVAVIAVIVSVPLFLLGRRLFRRVRQRLAQSKLIQDHGLMADELLWRRSSDYTLFREPETAIDSRWRLNAEDVRLDACIGAGVSGAVYRGRWKTVPVAVKIFQMDNNVSNLISEVNLLARLHHPHIVRMFGVVDLGGLPRRAGIVMELVDHGNLWQLLHGSLDDRTAVSPGGHSLASQSTADGTEFATRASHPSDFALPLPGVPALLCFQRVVEIAISIASGMAYLHSNKPPILHRDLKPSNVLISTTKETKIADFGISRMRDEATDLMTFCGTPRWAAPEVIRGDAYDLPSDVWSFGVILWEMLSGEPPYKNKGLMKAVLEVSAGQLCLQPPQDAHPELAALVTDCLQFDATKRPTFPAIYDRLDALLPPTAVPIGPQP